MGWKAGVHSHHDHRNPSRFAETVICDHCNAVDGRVWRHFRDKIAREFSYSPSEIRQIVNAAPHRGHVLNFEKAWEIYHVWVEAYYAEDRRP
jgi:hypothetical protein